jgi:membrane protease YdiL (CAAX protease family)
MKQGVGEMVSMKQWGVESVFRLMAAVFLALAVVGMASGLTEGLLPGKGDEARQMLVGAAGTFVFHVVTLGLVGWFLGVNRSTWGEAFGWSWRRLGWAGLLSVGLTLVVVPANLGLLWASQRLMGWARIEVAVQPTVQAVETLQAAGSSGELVLMGILAMGTAPLVEEVLFRGILFPAIREVGFSRLAWWLPSLLFAVTHASLVAFLPLTFFALVLTWLYEQTGNLTVPILTHSLYNAANFVWLVGMIG